MSITTTTKDIFLCNSQQKQEHLKSVVEDISNNKAILMHVFSKGGSNKACELAEAYYNTTSQQLPVFAFCFYSTPGFLRYFYHCNALNNSLPAIPVFQLISFLFDSAVLRAIWITYAVFKGLERNVVPRTRQQILDETYFGHTILRCYLYSKEDALIAW